MLGLSNTLLHSAPTADPVPVDLDGIQFFVEDFYDDDHFRVVLADTTASDTARLRFRAALNYDNGLGGNFDGEGDKMPGSFTVVLERFSDLPSNGGTSVSSSTGTLQLFRLSNAAGASQILSGYLLESTATNVPRSNFDAVEGSALIDLSAYGNNDITTTVPYLVRGTITYNPEAGSGFLSGTSAVTSIITVTNEAP